MISEHRNDDSRDCGDRVHEAVQKAPVPADQAKQHDHAYDCHIYHVKIHDLIAPLFTSVDCSTVLRRTAGFCFCSVPARPHMYH